MRFTLLQGKLPTMIVCVCNRVSDREITRQAHAGMSFDDIQLELGVATCCGRCEGCARELVEQCSTSHPIAALHLNTPVAPGAAVGV